MVVGLNRNNNAIIARTHTMNFRRPLLLALLLFGSRLAAALPPGVATHIIVFKAGVDADIDTPKISKSFGLGITHTFKHALRGRPSWCRPDA